MNLVFITLIEDSIPIFGFLNLSNGFTTNKILEIEPRENKI